MKLAKSTTTSGIKITVDSAMPEDPKFYTLTARAVFTSGYEQTSTINIVVQQDSDIIVPASKSSMFNPLNTTWETQFGSPIGKNNMYKVDLMAITDVVDFSASGSELPNFVTYNNDYLFKYLINCEGIIIDGCTSLQNTADAITGSDKNQFNFSNMTKLKKFYAQNCTGLTGTIDLSMCTDLEEVDVSGTTINVAVPTGTKITKYELGTPTVVSLINPTSINPNNVVVGSSSSISSIDLINIPNNKAFATFAKIMNLS
jgi:hypothetical protein